jgi:hypothetical protein
MFFFGLQNMVSRVRDGRNCLDRVLCNGEWTFLVLDIRWKGMMVLLLSHKKQLWWPTLVYRILRCCLSFVEKVTMTENSGNHRGPSRLFFLFELCMICREMVCVRDAPFGVNSPMTFRVLGPTKDRRHLVRPFLCSRQPYSKSYRIEYSWNVLQVQFSIGKSVLLAGCIGAGQSHISIRDDYEINCVR